MQPLVIVPALAGLLAVAHPGLARSAQDDEAPRLDPGQFFRASCIGCHDRPDARFETDRAWLQQVYDTAWSDTPKSAREALVTYLENTSLSAPEAVTKAPEEGAEGLGFVDTTFREGAIFVRDEKGKTYRLSWEALDGAPPPADRRRALPPGKYRVTGYRIVDRSREDEVWHLSATAKRIATFEVAAEKTHEVEIDPGVVIRKRLRGERVDVAVQGMHKAGLTIYKEGKRIPLGFRLVRGDRELAQGAIEYG